MNKLIQLLATCRVVDLAQTRSIDPAVGRLNPGPELGDDGLVNRAAWLKQLVCYSIGVDQPATQFHEHRGDCGLAGRDAAGQPDLDHLNASTEASGLDCVGHQHRDRHRPDSPGNRRHHGGHFLHFPLMDVPHPDVAPLVEQIEPWGIISKQPDDFIPIRHLVAPHVDDNRAVLDEVGGDQGGLPYRRDDDVAPANHFRQVRGLRVTDRYRRVGMHQEHCQRLSNIIAAPEHRRARAFDPNAGPPQHLHHAKGSARHEAFVSKNERPDISGMKAVDVLERFYGFKDGMFVHVLRER